MYAGVLLTAYLVVINLLSCVIQAQDKLVAQGWLPFAARVPGTSVVVAKLAAVLFFACGMQQNLECAYLYSIVLYVWVLADPPDPEHQLTGV